MHYAEVIGALGENKKQIKGQEVNERGKAQIKRINSFENSN